MKWRKLGQLFVPENNFPWMASHASNPFVEMLADNSWRVYFSSRNELKQSYIAYVDIDPFNNYKVINVSSEPVLSPGEPGTFDDSGVSLGHMMLLKDKKWIYYLGWNLKVTVPWLNSIGLAIWKDDQKKFVKHSRAPIMDRSEEDPFSISYPFVLLDGSIYRMWYGTNLKWGKAQNEMNHVIKYAESSDGIVWKRSNQIAINHQYKNEYAVSKPFVIKDSDRYRMWYSYRGNDTIDKYRIGLAESTDGKQWVRKDSEVGIDVSADGWDSDMICYPHIFDFKGNRYMLYNGNDYGKTGFGLAVLEQG